MADKKVIAVTGATGNQGGGMVRAILADPGSGFAVRALTRNPESDKAKELAKAGAEVVAADQDDVESLKHAFRGAYGVFGVTFFWAHFSPEKEIAEAGNLAKAAKDAGVQHFVWSTLEDTRRFIPLSDNRLPTLQGKYKVPHFDSKGSSDHFFADLGVPTTNLLTAFYWDNFVFFGMGPKRGPDGKLAITMPMEDKKLPSIAAGDIGGCALGIFKRGKEFIGKTVGIAGGHPTGAELAASFTRALGQEVRYNAISADAYRALGFPGAEDLGNMFQFKCIFQKEYLAARDLAFSRSLYPKLQTFDQWLAANKSRIAVD